MGAKSGGGGGGGKGGDPPFFRSRPGTNKERDSLTDTTQSVEPGLTGGPAPRRSPVSVKEDMGRHLGDVKLRETTRCYHSYPV